MIIIPEGYKQLLRRNTRSYDIAFLGREGEDKIVYLIVQDKTFNQDENFSWQINLDEGDTVEKVVDRGLKVAKDHLKANGLLLKQLVAQAGHRVDH